MFDFNCDQWFWHLLTIVEPKIPCERLCPRVDLCECHHYELIIDFCLSSFANHLLACYRWSRPSFFFLLYNWANPLQVDFLCKLFESSLSLKDKMCHSLNLEHSEDFDYLTLRLREQIIVSHECGSSLGELLLIYGSMRKFVKSLIQFIKKKIDTKNKSWCKQVGNWFHLFNGEGRKILSWLD